MSVVGTIVANIIADTTRFVAGLDSARNRSKKFQMDFQGISSSLLTVGNATSGVLTVVDLMVRGKEATLGWAGAINHFVGEMQDGLVKASAMKDVIDSMRKSDAEMAAGVQGSIDKAKGLERKPKGSQFSQRFEAITKASNEAEDRILKLQTSLQADQKAFANRRMRDKQIALSANRNTVASFSDWDSWQSFFHETLDVLRIDTDESNPVLKRFLVESRIEARDAKKENDNLIQEAQRQKEAAGRLAEGLIADTGKDLAAGIQKSAETFKNLGQKWGGAALDSASSIGSNLWNNIVKRNQDAAKLLPATEKALIEKIPALRNASAIDTRSREGANLIADLALPKKEQEKDLKEIAKNTDKEVKATKELALNMEKFANGFAVANF